VADSCEHGDETWGFKEGGEFIVLHLHLFHYRPMASAVSWLNILNFNNIKRLICHHSMRVVSECEDIFILITICLTTP
jgi:hypothetical protein